MSTLSFTLHGDVNVSITVTELDDGTLKFDLEVLDDTGSIGDLNAIFFDLAGDIDPTGLAATGDDVTGMKFKEEGVTKIDNYTNINGEVVNEYGKFDSGIQFGTAGIGEDDIRETSFILSHSDMALTIDALLGQDFAARLTSVGAEDGSREDSLKLGGESPTEPDPDTDPEPDPVNVANDDVLTVSETETFSSGGSTDNLDSGASSVLENDTTDGFDYTGVVTGTNESPDNIGEIVIGSNGGLLIMYEDGTVDFSANGEFDDLFDGEVAQTEFTYEIEGGDTATLTVNVWGEDEMLPG
ncbi:hypothetical protein AAFO92_07925 [Roseovarius sp. CAU 1744]|uniref:hypothetical protein n=1 Tax=Roseovarius sp. CAU 1744 TaxID=3140368 RepID=UPI00325BCA37